MICIFTDVFNVLERNDTILNKLKLTQFFLNFRLICFHTVFKRTSQTKDAYDQELQRSSKGILLTMQVITLNCTIHLTALKWHNVILSRLSILPDDTGNELFDTNMNPKQ